MLNMAPHVCLPNWGSFFTPNTPQNCKNTTLPQNFAYLSLNQEHLLHFSPVVSMPCPTNPKRSHSRTSKVVSKLTLQKRWSRSLSSLLEWTRQRKSVFKRDPWYELSHVKSAMQKPPFLIRTKRINSIIKKKRQKPIPCKKQKTLIFLGIQTFQREAKIGATG